MTGTKREAVVDYLRTLRENAAPGAHLASVQSIMDEVDCSIPTAVYGVVAAREAGVAVKAVQGIHGGYFAISETELRADLAASGDTPFARQMSVLVHLSDELSALADELLEKGHLVRTFHAARTTEDSPFFDSALLAEYEDLTAKHVSLNEAYAEVNAYLDDLHKTVTNGKA